MRDPRFTVAVTLVVGNCVKQVPIFMLDANTHGLAIAEDAERFAIRMFRDLMGDDLQVNACALEVRR